MIKSFRDAHTRRIYERQGSRRFDARLLRAAERKLAMLDAAETVADLRVPPGNRIEKLAGDRKGQHSIRINHQWRICFVWKDGAAHDVEIVDYL